MTSPFLGHASFGLRWGQTSILKWDTGLSLESITIPNSVTSIGEDAFNGCTSLASVTIGNSVTSIGGDAFKYCSSLEKVQYKGTLAQWCEIDNNSYLVANAQSIILSDGTDLKAETELIIPDGVTKIGNYTFSGCTSLTSITIPDSVTSIGDYAFRNCTSLTSVTIPDSVTSIGGDAFSGCSSLTSVTIPDSVTTIEYGAFYKCTSLQLVIYDGAESDWHKIKFEGNTGLYGKTIVGRNRAAWTHTGN